jgi:hypothetical protein
MWAVAILWPSTEDQRMDAPPIFFEHDPAWHGKARHGMARHGTAWHGTAWHGTAWHGMNTT